MSFSVDDFQDLVRLVGEHPEWRSELRRLVLSDDFLRLPEIVTEARSHADDRFSALAEAQARTERRLEELTSAVMALTTTVARMGERLDRFVGTLVELKYRDRGPAFFSRIARRLRLLSYPEIDSLLEPAVDSGLLTEDQADDIRNADGVLQGRARDGGAEVYLVLEASAQVDAGDIERALKRAEQLSRAGVKALAVVAGEQMADGAAELAQRLGVWQVTDGKTEQPAAGASQ